VRLFLSADGRYIKLLFLLLFLRLPIYAKEHRHSSLVCVDIVVRHFYRPFPSVILKKHKDSLSRLALCFDFVVFYIFALYYEPAVIFSISLVFHFVNGVNKKMEIV
jgi:hypothetical protein